MRASIRLALVGSLLVLMACDPGPIRPDATTGTDAGTGTDECAAPRTVCGSQCVDVDSDPRHCGECGNRCPAGAFCSGGSCATSCAAPLEACGESCVDLATSSDHCGRCGYNCLADEMCVSGGCVCATGLSMCAGSCVDRDTNSMHCGRCDNPCGQQEVCVGGTCQASAESDCLDSMDNDMDGDIDCADSDCVGVERDCTCPGGTTGDMPTETCEAGGTWGTCGPCGPAPDCSASNPCDYGYNCSSGTCVFNPGALYVVELVDAPFIPRYKYDNESTWDSPFYRNPDVYGEIYLSPGVSEGRSTTQSDTFTPVWNERVLGTGYSATQLMSYFELRMYDDDVGADELIGRCSVTLRERDFGGGLRTVLCGRNTTEMTVGYRANLRFHPAL